MTHNVYSTLEQLFHADQPSGKKLTFRWRLVSREGRPLLLLPESGAGQALGLELYAAQRFRAKMWKAALPMLLRAPTRTLATLISFEADAACDFLKFVAEQTGVAAEALKTPAIKFGGLGSQKSRIALLVCDQTDRPAKVIKVGFNGDGRSANEYEVQLMKRLPGDVIGCVRLSGEIACKNWTAFATPFFPGASPENDAGMELVFNSWLNPGAEPMALEEFQSWKNLEAKIPASHRDKLKVILAATQGKKLRSTLYHGDFAPWNLRAINALNLQAYDWEFGHSQGIPGWDWFHFIVQTSILVKRHSPARVAAELEALIQSPRFKDYAKRAGIEEIVEPLLLGFLLHHDYVVRPMDGREIAHQLFNLLWQHWHSGDGAGNIGSPAKPATQIKPELAPAGAFLQIESAFASLVNLFWRPSLTHANRQPWTADLKQFWKPMLASLLWIACLAQLPLRTNPHLMFAPFYLVPCIFMALHTNYRLASLIAFVAGFGGPLVFFYWNHSFASLQVILWNGLMRYFVFQIVVVLFNRIRQQSALRLANGNQPEKNPLHEIAGNWPVILFTLIFLMVVILIDYLSGVNALMTGLYIIPCMLITLALDWRWGTLLAVACALIGPVMQLSDPGYRPWEIQFWNTCMRLVMYEMVVLMIERVRRENILFAKTGQQ